MGLLPRLGPSRISPGSRAPVGMGGPPRKVSLSMKKGIHPDYHFVEVQLNDGTHLQDAHHLRHGGPEGHAGHRSHHPPGLDRRPAAADGPRRAADALQQEVCRIREGAERPFHRIPKRRRFPAAFFACGRVSPTRSPATPDHPFTSRRTPAPRRRSDRVRRRRWAPRLRQTEHRPAGRCGDKDCRCAPEDP